MRGTAKQSKQGRLLTDLSSPGHQASQSRSHLSVLLSFSMSHLTSYNHLQNVYAVILNRNTVRSQHRLITVLSTGTQFCPRSYSSLLCWFKALLPLSDL